MKYFTINELCKSDTAKAKGIDNTPTPQVVSNLTKLVDNVLDPLREAWGRPIYINSGYRSPVLNKAVSGAATSEHMHGNAADITAGNPTLNRQLFELVVKLNLPYRQLIDEKNYQWLHISYNPNDIKRQILHLK